MAWIRRLITCLILSAALSGTGCRKKPEKPKSAKKQREEALQKASDTQAALGTFVGAVSEVLVWYQAQPDASEAERTQTRKALAEKMVRIPAKGLPGDLMKAWDEMLNALQALAIMPAPDAVLLEQGSKAAEELNRQLTTHGVTGIRF